MLEARLKELSPIVDGFVIAESTTTFRGDPKPLYYAESAARFSEWASRITHIVVEPPETQDPWVRERHQRNATMEGILDADDDDLILSCDVDEIPRREAIPRVLRSSVNGPVTMSMSNYHMSLNWRGMSWNRPKAIRKRDLTMSFSELRDNLAATYVPCVGWHFTSFGGAEMVSTKLKSFSHSEYETEKSTDLTHLRSCIEEGVLPWGVQAMDWVRQSFPAHIEDALGSGQAN